MGLAASALLAWAACDSGPTGTGVSSRGGRRTADARARLSSPGWRRAVLLHAEASSLRALALALVLGACLHRTDKVIEAGYALYEAAKAAPFLTKLVSLQAILGSFHLSVARACLKALPRRIYLHVAVRQVDLSFGGAGTYALLGLLKFEEVDITQGERLAIATAVLREADAAATGEAEPRGAGQQPSANGAVSSRRRRIRTGDSKSQ